jgi:hypothetical protein
VITLGISRYGNGLHDLCELIRDIVEEKEAMSHQNRRTPLPKDYQFGDAGRGPTPSQVSYETSHASWLRVLAGHFTLIENGRYVLRPGTELFAWTPMRLRAIANLLERAEVAPKLLSGPTPSSPRFFPAWRGRHENAAEELARKGEYNVIEGEHE